MAHEGGIEQQRRQRFARWKANMTAMKESVRERFRVTSVPQRFLRQSQRLQPVVSLRATATGIVVARVFHGNIVLARVARSMAKNEWRKRIRRLADFLPSFGTIAASVSAGSLAFGEPAQAEALTLRSGLHHCVSGLYDDHEVSITLKRQRSGKQALILASDPSTTASEDVGLFQDDSAFLKMMQAVAVPLIGNACHVFMHGLNSTEVYGAEKMQQAVFQRPVGQPLITVSNHTAAVDDPFVISSVLPPHKLLNANNLRWTLCASEKCFSNPALSAFFRSVKVLPLTKGHGVFQEGMEVAIKKLNQGEWVHIFPEGSRSRDGHLQLFKRGVGRLVLDAENLPLVVPFIHTGMNDIMPIGQKYFSTGQKITVLVGDPINVDDLVKKYLDEGLSKAVLYDAIALRIESTMWRLKTELDELVARNESRIREDGVDEVQITDKVQSIWQYVDWEAHGFFRDDVSSRPDAGVASKVKDHMAQLDACGTSSCLEEKDPVLVDPQHCHSNESEVCLTHIYNEPLSRTGTDPCMFMGFAARGLIASRAKLDDSLESLRRRYWRSISVI